MRKSFLKKAAVFAISLSIIASITGCGGAEQANNSGLKNGVSAQPPEEGSADSEGGITAKKIRVAYQPGVYAANILLAKKNGYFEEEIKNLGYSDIEITWDSFDSGPPENEAFAAGAEDIGLIGDVPLLVAKASGQKTVTFAKLSSGETTVALTIPSDSEVKDVSELKGKKIAYVKGSYGQHFLGLLLKNAGLTFNDIEEINLPNADIGNTVATKQADAGIIWEPGLSSTLATGNVKILTDGTGIKSNNVFFFATQDFADNNHDALVAYIKAVERANDEIAKDPAAAAEALKDDINLPTDTLAALLPKYEFKTYISDSDISELKDVENFNREQKFAENEVDVDTFVDRKYLTDAGITSK